MAIVTVCVGSLAAASEPLASQNEGPAKKAILEFVGAVTGEKGRDYAPPGLLDVAQVAQRLDDVFAGQNVGIKQVEDKIWLVSFMQYDLGFFDEESCRLGNAQNPFGAKVLPMSPE